ncbi:MAG: sigma-70 family RNA polymerase sigma factor [Dehalococcoidia bacterium]
MNAEAVSVSRGGPPGEATPDDEVIARCQDGAGEAFEVIVRRYADQVFGTIFLMTHERRLSEDLTQETFVRAWRGLNGFYLGEPLRPWLLRIAANVVVSHRRKRWLPFVPLSRVDRDTPSREPSPEAQAEQVATGDELQRAIAELREDHRQVVVLRFYAELSVPEIARATRWAEGTVKSRLHRALRRMRASLEPPLEE